MSYGSSHGVTLVQGVVCVVCGVDECFVNKTLFIIYKYIFFSFLLA